MIGDLSSDEEEKAATGSIQGFTESVRESTSFFERLSKGPTDQGTPDFKKNKRDTIRSQAEQRNENRKPGGGRTIKNLFAKKTSQRKIKAPQSEKKTRNAFPSQPTEERKEIIIGDSSSDEEVKSKQETLERSSVGRQSIGYASIGAKEGLVQSIPLDVATLSNFVEARIKSQGISAQERSDSQDSDMIVRKKSKNIFKKSETSESKGKQLSDLFAKKEHIIGDDTRTSAKNMNIFYKKKPKIEAIEEQNEDVATHILDENIAEDFIDAYYVYLSLIDDMTFGVINSTFHDIRLFSKFEGSAESIIHSAMKSILQEAAKESYQILIDEEEHRQKEIQQIEAHRKALAEKRERELAQLRHKQQEEIAQFDKAIPFVFDDIIKTFTKDLAERCIFDEKNRHKKEFKIAMRHERDFVIYCIVRDQLKDLGEECIVEAHQEQQKSLEIINQNLNEVRNTMVDKVVTDQVYDIVFEEIKDALDSEAENCNNIIIEQAIQKSVEGVILETIIPQEIQNNIFQKVSNNMVEEIISSTFSEMRQDATKNIRDIINLQITSDLVESEVLKLLTEISKESIIKNKAMNNLNCLRILFGDQEFYTQYSYYIDGLRNDDMYVVRQIAGINTARAAQNAVAIAQDTMLEETMHHMVAEVVGNCMKEAKRLRNHQRKKPKINTPKYAIIGKDYLKKRSKYKNSEIIQFNENIKEIRDDILENQVMQLLSEMIVDGLTEQKKMIQQEQQVNSPPRASILYQPEYESDSFDELESDIEPPSIQYDYSPEYKMYTKEGPSLIISEPKEETKGQYAPKQFFLDETEDECQVDSDVNDEPSFRISDNLGNFYIDTSKVQHKMEDTGYSPFKDLKSDRTYQPTLPKRKEKEVDAMCINCNEFIPAKNIELHSQYCTGKPAKKKNQRYRTFVDDDLDLTEFLGHETGEETIPRINQKLYKIMKSLKHKETETMCDSQNIDIFNRSSFSSSFQPSQTLSSDITFVHSLSSLCKEIMINNIDLDKLDLTGSKLIEQVQNFEMNNDGSDNRESILIIAQTLLQIFESKRTVVANSFDCISDQDQDSYVYGSYANYSMEDYAQSPATQSLRAPDFDVFDSSEVPVIDNEDHEDDELVRQEKEIEKWKGIYNEMSRRLKETGSTGEAFDNYREYIREKRLVSNSSFDSQQTSNYQGSENSKIIYLREDRKRYR
ncbi:unnamed protein product [Moneuplotes crassus]|uniref:Uncharacterized protein n=1 Tax=Euplotes crassus TaxID=5936 RepID=A0AAD1UKE7_EUPCR|nr:unnamed protein product [Moneuplotes crassus]